MLALLLLFALSEGAQAQLPTVPLRPSADYVGVESSYSRVPAQPARELPLLSAAAAPGAVEQVHLQAGASPEGVTISWSVVPDAAGSVPPGSCTVVLVWPAGAPAGQAPRRFRCEVPDCGTTPSGSLAYVRKAVVSGLSASTSYTYEIPGSNSSFRGTFVTTPPGGAQAITFGVVGDVGQV